jgi:hypothetical protein
VKSKKRTVVFLVLSALLWIHSRPAEAKGQGKPFTSHRGDQAAEHMSSNGSTNGNAQWSADPSRGWVRAEERSKLRKPGTASKPNPDKGKQQAKGKGY